MAQPQSHKGEVSTQDARVEPVRDARAERRRRNYVQMVHVVRGQPPTCDTASYIRSNGDLVASWDKYDNDLGGHIRRHAVAYHPDEEGRKADNWNTRKCLSWILLILILSHFIPSARWRYSTVFFGTAVAVLFRFWNYTVRIVDCCCCRDVYD